MHLAHHFPDHPQVLQQRELQIRTLSKTQLNCLFLVKTALAMDRLQDKNEWPFYKQVGAFLTNRTLSLPWNKSVLLISFLSCERASSDLGTSDIFCFSEPTAAASADTCKQQYNRYERAK